MRMGEISHIMYSALVTFLIWHESNSQNGIKKRRENLGFICRKENIGELMLFSLFINKLTKRNSRTMALSGGTLCGKYSMLKDQVKLADLFCHNLLGDLYCLYATFKPGHFDWVYCREKSNGKLLPSFSLRYFFERLLAAKHWAKEGSLVEQSVTWASELCNSSVTW